jgi:N-acetyl-gamma-glutamylphosphate reductase
MIDLKQVVNTNKCLIHIEKQGDKIAIHTAIDNLLKGAVRASCSKHEYYYLDLPEAHRTCDLKANQFLVRTWFANSNK